jgi:hypothetical protein
MTWRYRPSRAAFASISSHEYATESIGAGPAVRATGTAAAAATTTATRLLLRRSIASSS